MKFPLVASLNSSTTPPSSYYATRSAAIPPPPPTLAACCRCSHVPRAVRLQAASRRRARLNNNNNNNNNALLQQRSNKDVGGRRPLAVINVVYHVLFIPPNNSSSNVSGEQIAAQHHQLNLDFSRLNADTDHVPTSGRWNFSAQRGSPDIGFAPVSIGAGAGNVAPDPSTLDIRRVALPANSGGVGSISELDSSKVSPPVDGSLNVYFAPLPDGLLGQAYIEFNEALVSFLTVGSFESPSPSAAPYGFGRSLAHEVAHAFGILHPFAYGCGGTPYSDLPSVRLPNFAAKLEFVNGAWDGRLCNHDRDAHPNDSDFSLSGATRPYSCTVVGAPNEHYEQFFNMLDYATDKQSIMVTKEQADQMRAFVTMSGVFDFEMLVIIL